MSKDKDKDKDKPSKQERQAIGWAAFTGLLSQSARATVQRKPASVLQPAVAREPPSEDNVQYAEFRGKLSETTRDRVDDTVHIQESSQESMHPVDAEARFCLVEAPDGEWPSVRMLKTPEALAHRVRSLEGQDVVVWAFYGIPLQLTRGPQRFLVMPDQQTAIQIPALAKQTPQLVSLDVLDNAEIQDDGFLGPREWSQTNPPAAKRNETRERRVVPRSRKRRDDDDDDDMSTPDEFYEP